MGAVILRAQTCLMCGGPLPQKGRVDRRYCKGACRTLAYRVRHRIKAVRPPGPLEPEWAEPNAVVTTMLTSLAQIQARVLDFAHQLEHEELYARLPVKTAEDLDHESASSIAEEPVVDPREQLPLFEETESATQNEHAQSQAETISALHEALSQANDDRARAEDRADIAELETEETTRELIMQRDQLQAELLTERELSGKLDAKITSLHKEATDIIGNLQSQHDYVLHENQELASKFRELEARLRRAQEALDAWDRVGAESQSIVARNNTLLAENSALKAEVQRLRPPSAQADALTRLMIDRVKALHWLAVYDARVGNKTTGQLLPSYDTPNILSAAQYQAFAARRDFYLQVRGPLGPKPQWLSEDRLLDEQSEKQIYESEHLKNNYIFSRLGSARRKAGENP